MPSVCAAYAEDSEALVLFVVQDVDALCAWARDVYSRVQAAIPLMPTTMTFPLSQLEGVYAIAYDAFRDALEEHGITDGGAWVVVEDLSGLTADLLMSEGEISEGATYLEMTFRETLCLTTEDGAVPIRSHYLMF